MTDATHQSNPSEPQSISIGDSQCDHLLVRNTHRHGSNKSSRSIKSKTGYKNTCRIGNGYVDNGTSLVQPLGSDPDGNAASGAAYKRSTETSKMERLNFASLLYDISSGDSVIRRFSRSLLPRSVRDQFDQRTAKWDAEHVAYIDSLLPSPPNNLGEQARASSTGCSENPMDSSGKYDYHNTTPNVTADIENMGLSNPDNKVSGESVGDASPTPSKVLESSSSDLTNNGNGWTCASNDNSAGCSSNNKDVHNNDIQRFTTTTGHRSRNDGRPGSSTHRAHRSPTQYTLRSRNVVRQNPPSSDDSDSDSSSSSSSDDDVPIPLPAQHPVGPNNVFVVYKRFTPRRFIWQYIIFVLILAYVFHNIFLLMNLVLLFGVISVYYYVITTSFSFIVDDYSIEVYTIEYGAVHQDNYSQRFLEHFQAAQQSHDQPLVVELHLKTYYRSLFFLLSGDYINYLCDVRLAVSIFQEMVTVTKIDSTLYNNIQIRFSHSARTRFLPELVPSLNVGTCLLSFVLILIGNISSQSIFHVSNENLISWFFRALQPSRIQSICGYDSAADVWTPLWLGFSGRRPSGRLPLSLAAHI